jgi:hypothetical protein
MEYKLGKKPVRKDVRTLKLSTVLKALPPVPDTFDVDSQYPNLVDNNIFANDKYGDCVLADQAHHTLRFEIFEQNQLLPITDQEVINQYLKETGGADNGLVMLDALNEWRQNGWTVGGKTYKIHAFASVDYKNHDEVKAGIYLFNGISIGVQVAQYYYDEFGKGNYFWDLVSSDGGIIGGHALYVMRYLKVTGYNDIGPVFITWGKYVQVTWPWWDKYVDEGYIIIDERDSWIPQDTDPLKIPVLQQYLAEVTGLPSQKIAILNTELPNGTVNMPYVAWLTCQGGTPPYKWSVSPGVLPAGITMADDGTISGTPTVAETVSNIIFMVSDAVGNQSGIYLSITIKSPPTPSSCKAGNAVAKAMNIIGLQKLRKRKGRFMYMDPGK